VCSNIHVFLLLLPDFTSFSYIQHIKNCPSSVGLGVAAP